MRFLARLLVNGVALLVAAWLIPGIRVASPAAALIAGAILGFVNALVRPVLVLLTLPITFVTLGLFLLVINGLCFALTAALVPGFSLAGFFPAVLGALVVTVVSWILNGALVRKD
jgi:putative membrane protein